MAFFADEDYELMYEEELELMDEIEEPQKKIQKTSSGLTSSTQHQQKNVSTILSSPALSQISHDGFALTPAQNKNINKKTSTPFLSKLQELEEEKNNEEIENRALNEIQNVGIKRKRRVLNDLFGDLYDLEEEDDDGFKKPRTDEERDMDTIQKIIEARKELDTQLFPLKTDEFDRLEALFKFKKENLSSTIPKYPFISLSKNDDDRIYVRCHTQEFEDRALKEIKAVDSKGSELFREQQREAMWREANEIILKDSSATQKNAILQQVHMNRNENVSDLLLVDKYRPKKYFDLLSEESLNRSLLQWIKLFDKVVFNREVVKKSAKPGELSNFNKKTGRFELNGGWHKKRANNLNTELDENGCPIQKVALLVGKPGLAKTTLAHVIARHAGYEVQEKNASDERSVEDFRQTLENATQMSSVLNAGNRPNCIIFDEIDGAPTATVEFLVRYVSGQVSEKGKKGGKNKKKFILKRPIICICNDLYGANLRQLRQIAFVVNFQTNDTTRLAERLQQICIREHIKTDMTALLAMAEKSGSDIRSCMSIIQFFASKKQPLTLFDVLKSDIGQKDQHKSLFNAWTTIFQIQRPKKVIKSSDDNNGQRQIGMSDTSVKTRVRNVLETVSSCGEYEKLISGVHENYLRQKMQNVGFMEGIVEATNWFCFNDQIQRLINTTQNYSMYPYFQYAFASWHLSFASMAYPQLNYPHKQFEVSQKLNTAKQIFGNMKKGISANVRGIGSGNKVLVDAMSLLKLIINPEVRSVSMHLMTQKEKQELQHTVEIIADFNLTLIQMQSGDGTNVYRVEPDIDFFSFTGIPQKQISYWSKQMIAQEVEVEKMRRSKPKLDNADETALIVEEEKSEKKSSPIAENKPLPNHLQRLIPKAIKSAKPAQLICKDFFGRIISKPSVVAASTPSQIESGETSSSSSSSDILVKSPIWFKFKEGYNSAVRTDFHFSDLL